MTTLLERAPEMDLINAALEGMKMDGSGRMVVFEGPPGVGKTSMLTWARGEAHRQAFAVLTASGRDLERDYAWGLVRQLFERTSRDDDHTAAFCSAAGPAIELVTGRNLQMDEQIDRYPLIHSLLELTNDLASRRPLLIVADDLHWSDVASLRFLTYLAGRLDHVPVVVIGAVRPAAVDEHVLLSLITTPPVTIHRLRPLTDEAAGRLLAQVLGTEPDAELTRRCQELARGNGFFLRELARQLARAHSRAEMDDILRTRIPSIDRYVRLQLNRLPTASQDTAYALSVLADGATVEQIAAVAGQPPDVVLERICALLAAELVEPVASGTYALSHPLISASVYKSMNPSTRARLHARAAQEAVRDHDTERAATHLLRVPAGVASIDTASVLREAADRSAARGALHSTVAFLRRLLDENRGELRVAVNSRLGTSQALIDVEGAQRHLSDAMAVEQDPERSAQLALTLAAAMFNAGRPHEIGPLLNPVLEQHTDLAIGTQRALHAWLITAKTMTPTGQRPRDWLDNVSDLPPDRSAGGSMLDGALSLVYCLDNQREPARARALRTIANDELATQVMAERLAADGPLSSAWATLVACDEPAALASIDAGLRRARQAGTLRTLAPAACHHAAVMLSRGNLREAISHGQAAWDASRAGSVVAGMNFVGGHLLRALVARGRLADAEAMLVQLRVEGAPLPRYVDANGELSVLLALGRVDEAMNAIEAARRDSELFAVTNPVICEWRGYLVRCLRRKGDREQARSIAADNLALAEAWGTARAIGRALRIAAMAEKRARQLEMLDQSVRVLNESDARLELALSELAFGDALRRAKRIQDAQTHLQRAVELADECGAEPVGHVSSQIMRLVGGRPKTVSLGPSSLTSGERRVVDLAVIGMSNRDVAQRLFVSVKTVELHLSNAFRKLGFRGRRDLAAALGEPAGGPTAMSPRVRPAAT